MARRLADIPFETFTRRAFLHTCGVQREMVTLPRHDVMPCQQSGGLTEPDSQGSVRLPPIRHHGVFYLLAEEQDTCQDNGMENVSGCAWP